MKEQSKNQIEKITKVVIRPSPAFMLGPFFVAVAILAGAVYSNNPDTNHIVPAALLILITLFLATIFSKGALVFSEEEMRKDSKSATYSNIRKVELESGGFGAGRYGYYNFYDETGEKVFTVNPGTYGIGAKRVNALLQRKLAHLNNIKDVAKLQPGITLVIWVGILFFSYAAFLESIRGL